MLPGFWMIVLERAAPVVCRACPGSRSEPSNTEHLRGRDLLRLLLARAGSGMRSIVHVLVRRDDRAGRDPDPAGLGRGDVLQELPHVRVVLERRRRSRRRRPADLPYAGVDRRARERVDRLARLQLRVDLLRARCRRRSRPPCTAGRSASCRRRGRCRRRSPCRARPAMPPATYLLFRIVSHLLSAFFTDASVNLILPVKSCVVLRRPGRADVDVLEPVGERPGVLRAQRPRRSGPSPSAFRHRDQLRPTSSAASACTS